MASQWNDDFDFDEVDYRHGDRKAKETKQVPKQEDDYFAAEEDTKSVKLPVISKAAASAARITNGQSSNNKAVSRDYAISEQIPEDLEDSGIGSAKRPLKTHSKGESAKGGLVSSKQHKKTEKEEEEFYESVKQTQKDALDVGKDYVEEEFDQYVQDFEDQKGKLVDTVNRAVKKASNAVNLKPKLQLRSNKQLGSNKQVGSNKELSSNKELGKDRSNQEHGKDKSSQGLDKNSRQKPPLNPNRIYTNKEQSRSSLSKGPGAVHPPAKAIVRSFSRKSIKSNSSKNTNGANRSRVRNDSQIDRHITLVEKSFPENEQAVGLLSIDKINRANDKMRAMIRKFNEQLNDLIERNMVYLKEKENQKEPNVDNKVKVVQQQVKSGAVAIEVMEKEFERLQGRQGELKEDEYEFIIEKKIQQVSDRIKQASKVILKLQHDVDSEGNKLSKQDIERKAAQEVHQVKTKLIQAKKDEERNDARIEKLKQMLEGLTGKLADKNYEMSQQLDQAKEKGICIDDNLELTKKYKIIETKRKTLEDHRKTIEAWAKTKAEQIIYENELICGSIKTFDRQIRALQQKSDQNHEQTIRIIEKAKQNPRSTPLFVQQLDKLLRAIEDSQTSRYEAQSQGNLSRVSMQQSKVKVAAGKLTPNSKISAPKNQEIRKGEVSLMKPNFNKRKAGENEVLSGKVEEQGIIKKEQPKARNNNEDQGHDANYKHLQDNKTIGNKDNSIAGNKNNNIAGNTFQSHQRAEQEKLKPFSLKKKVNTLRMQDHQQQGGKQQIQEQPAVLKEEDKGTFAAPKLLKINRRDKNAVGGEQLVQPVEPEPAKEEDKPIFAPRRLNLRNKVEKKEDIYTPSLPAGDKEDATIHPSQLPQEEYKPKFNFGVEDQYKKPKANVIDDSGRSIPVSGEEDKPKVVLRLRDRMKKQQEEQEQDGYLPTPARATEVPEERKQNNLYTGPTAGHAAAQGREYPAEATKNIIQAHKPVSIPKGVEPAQSVLKQAGNVVKDPSPEPVSKGMNPYAQKQSNPNNPYANQQAPKRERVGPVKKVKAQSKGPKERINIYEQAEDLTVPAEQIGGSPARQQPIHDQQLDLNAMLGIKKKDNLTQLDDLLGEVKVKAKKQRKRNDDFFNDLDV